MAWTDIANALVAIGARPRASLMAALRDNVIAVMDGDAGAPRLQLAALPRLVAGDVVRFASDAIASTASTAFTTVFNLSIIQSGTIRISFEHRSVTSGTSDARIRLNGVTEQEWTTGTGFVARTRDVTVAVGDTITIEHRHSTSFSTSEVRLRRASTSGAYIFPVSATAGYTF